MRVFWRGLVAVLLLVSTITPLAQVSAQEQSYIVIVKDEQRLYLAQGDPENPEKVDVIKNFPVTTGALWTQKGLETPSGVFTIIEKSNSPVQGGYDFSDTGDVTLTPYFMRLDVPNRGGIGIHTYTGRTLDLWRFGATGGQTTHGCIAGPPDDIIDLYKNYVRPGSTRVWIVDHPSEAFKDIPGAPRPDRTSVNGKVWRALPSPTKQQLFSVDMVRPDLGWAVAGDATFIDEKYAWESSILRWDGRRWTEETKVPYWLHGIDMLNEDEGWAVGQNYMAGVHRKNGKWTEVDRAVPRVPYMSEVSAINEDDAWMAGGGGEIFTYNGAKWDVFIAPDVMKTIRSMDMLDANTGWVVGGGWDTESEQKETVPMIASYDGKQWASDESPVDELWYGVDAVADDDAWAVGSNGAIIHWDGSAWKSVESPAKNRLSDVAMASARDGWAVGDEPGVALHWDGKAWSRVRLPLEEKFYEVSVLKDGSAMAVGGGGSIIQLVNGSQAPQPAKPKPTKPVNAPQPTPDAGSEPDVPYATQVAESPATTAADPGSVGAEADPTQERTIARVGAESTAIPAESTQATDAEPTVATAAPTEPQDTPPAATPTETDEGSFPVVPFAAAGAIAVAAGVAMVVRRRA